MIDNEFVKRAKHSGLVVRLSDIVGRYKTQVNNRTIYLFVLKADPIHRMTSEFMLFDDGMVSGIDPIFHNFYFANAIRLDD